MPYQTLTASGPMTFSEQNPNAGHRIVDFDPYTGSVDLSGISVGEEFTVSMESMALAMGITHDVEGYAKAFAYFRDPISLEGGVQVETSGLTATNNPRIPSVPVPTAFWLFLTGIGCIRCMKKFW